MLHTITCILCAASLTLLIISTVFLYFVIFFCFVVYCFVGNFCSGILLFCPYLRQFVLFQLLLFPDIYRGTWFVNPTHFYCLIHDFQVAFGVFCWGVAIYLVCFAQYDLQTKILCSSFMLYVRFAHLSFFVFAFLHLFLSGENNSLLFLYTNLYSPLKNTDKLMHKTSITYHANPTARKVFSTDTYFIYLFLQYI